MIKYFAPVFFAILTRLSSALLSLIIFSFFDALVNEAAISCVNPAAKLDKNSPIYGMPILDVEKSKSIVVLKRSMSPGFAGLDNDIFYNDKTVMLFGDAKDSIDSVTKSIKELL